MNLQGVGIAEAHGDLLDKRQIFLPENTILRIMISVLPT